MIIEKGNGVLFYASSIAGAAFIAGLLLSLDDELKMRAKEQTSAFLDITESLLKAYGKVAIRLISKTITQKDREQSIEKQWASVEAAQAQVIPR